MGMFLIHDHSIICILGKLLYVGNYDQIPCLLELVLDLLVMVSFVVSSLQNDASGFPLHFCCLFLAAYMAWNMALTL